jgi:hypothetical protein
MMGEGVVVRVGERGRVLWVGGGEGGCEAGRKGSGIVRGPQCPYQCESRQKFQ